MDRKKITEWVKWIVWVGSLIGMFVTWRVDKAKAQVRYDLVIDELVKDVDEIKQDAKDTKNYVLENKDNITRLTTWAELLAD